MNINYIIEHNLVGRYVAGELSDKEAEQFELAYFNDNELASLVETEQALQREFSKLQRPVSESYSPTSKNWQQWSVAAAIAGIFAFVPLLFYFGQISVSPYQLSSDSLSGPELVYELVQERGVITTTTVPIRDDSDDAIVFSVPVFAVEYEELHLTLVYENENRVWEGRWQWNGANLERTVSNCRFTGTDSRYLRGNCSKHHRGFNHC